MTEDHSNDFMVGSINISPQHNTITKGESTCRLQPKAMAVLHYLAKNKDRVINNDELLDQVWQGRIVTHSSIQKCVNALRTAFAELDNNVEYVVYFSKRGYQLVTPQVESNNCLTTIPNNSWRIPFLYLAGIIILALCVVYYFYLYQLKTPPSLGHKNISAFTQVKPYVSSTGRERIIEPHFNSDRVAFIRDEVAASGVMKSTLFIQGTNGQSWQLSTARGNFTYLAWSPSGRNLVAIDAHNDEQGSSSDSDKTMTANYHSLHIYTLDFKAEKVIETNRLSHWAGNVNSVAWWDEGTLEFTASQGGSYERARYRYGIADQNITTLKLSTDEGKLLSSHVFDKNTAILSRLDASEKIQFLDENQQLVGQWSIPFKVRSINWLSTKEGVLLLSSDNQLSLLNIDGGMNSIDYSPKVTGRIKQVRTKNKGKNIILTVEAPAIKNSSSATSEDGFSQERFLEKGGGFIYSPINSGI